MPLSPEARSHQGGGTRLQSFFFRARGAAAQLISSIAPARRRKHLLVPIKSLKTILPVAFVIVVALALLAAANPSILVPARRPRRQVERMARQRLACGGVGRQAVDRRRGQAPARAGACRPPCRRRRARGPGSQARAAGGLVRRSAARTGRDRRPGREVLAGAGRATRRGRFHDAEDPAYRRRRSPAGAAGGVQPIAALGQIGVSRALAPATLDALLDVAASRSMVAATALVRVEDRNAPRPAEPPRSTDSETIAQRAARRAAQRGDPGARRGGRARSGAGAARHLRHGLDPAALGMVLRNDDLQ